MYVVIQTALHSRDIVFLKVSRTLKRNCLPDLNMVRWHYAMPAGDRWNSNFVPVGL